MLKYANKTTTSKKPLSKLARHDDKDEDMVNKIFRYQMRRNILQLNEYEKIGKCHKFSYKTNLFVQVALARGPLSCCSLCLMLRRDINHLSDTRTARIMLLCLVSANYNDRRNQLQTTSAHQRVRLYTQKKGTVRADAAISPTASLCRDTVRAGGGRKARRTVTQHPSPKPHRSFLLNISQA